jgi:hypothetical protein
VFRKHERAAHPHLNPQKPKPFKISTAAAAAPSRGHQEGGGDSNTDPSAAGKRAAQASARQREIYLHTGQLQGSNPHLLTDGQATRVADNSHLAYAAVNRQNGVDGTADSRHQQFFNPVRN